MPPYRRTHFTYPLDNDIPLGTPGIWLELSTAPGLVGIENTDVEFLLTKGGSREERRAKLEIDLNQVFQALCEKRIKFSDMVNDSTKGDTISDDDPITRDLEAEPFCRYEDSNGDEVTGKTEVDKASIDVYVVRVVETFLPIVNINPVVLGAISVSNAASGIQRV